MELQNSRVVYIFGLYTLEKENSNPSDLYEEKNFLNLTTIIH